VCRYTAWPIAALGVVIVIWLKIGRGYVSRGLYRGASQQNKPIDIDNVDDVSRVRRSSQL